MIGTTQSLVSGPVYTAKKRSNADVFGILPTPYDGVGSASLPRRQFLCGPAFQCKHMTLTVAPAGVGKTSLTIAEAVHMAAGKPLFAQIEGPTKVWLFNGEESRDELERRVVGTIESHGLDATTVAQNLFFNSGRTHPIVLAETGSDGMVIHEDRAAHLVSVILERGIKVLIVDPFVSTHAVQENNNAAIDKVGKLWASIAERSDCAVHLVHHARKMGRSEMTAESVRGASSLVAAARFVRALSKVTPKEAGKVGWKGPGELVRVDVAKENNSSTTTQNYFSLTSHSLLNGPAGTRGDDVGIVTAFVPASAAPIEVTSDLTTKLMTLMLDYADRPALLRRDFRAKHWAGKIMGPVLGLDPVCDAKMLQDRLAQLLEERVLATDVWTGPNGRPAEVIVAGDRLLQRPRALHAEAA